MLDLLPNPEIGELCQGGRGGGRGQPGNTPRSALGPRNPTRINKSLSASRLVSLALGRPVVNWTSAAPSTSKPTMSLAELLGALSHALDLTEGQPPGHCVRCCWIGVHIGEALGLGEAGISELYYTLLLKDLGCSSNAARICELYLTDDLTIQTRLQAGRGQLAAPGGRALY